MAGDEAFERGALMTWVHDRGGRVPRQRGRLQRVDVYRRFAFYGRISTDGYQDADTSREWQRCAAAEFLAGRGVIVTEYFDVGHSRLQEWADRPQAGALLAALTDPHRRFDAIVVGEYERAFCGNQLLGLPPLLDRHAVQLWLPELDGPFDAADIGHRATIRALGAYSRREILQARFRTSSAMHAQARLQGRHLGGRPPYGYRLVDAGPHPNAVHAKWGRRLHRLEPDPQTAPTVRWIFAQRLEGRSVGGVARELNEIGIPCPSGADPDRNRHRSG
jgi:DNA invertase Pin-like site-specific DNA recombinase